MHRVNHEVNEVRVCIFCGGSGTRLREQTEFLPKPLIRIGGKPMIYHIMKQFDYYGYRDFVLALGYKQEEFKKYFAHFDEINNDVTMRIGSYLEMNFSGTVGIDWKVTLSDTGENTLKGGRLKRVEKYIVGEDFFCCHGDGIGNINLKKLFDFHRSHGKVATITGVHPPARFGEIIREGETVKSFSEKPKDTSNLINAGYFVFNRKIFDYLEDAEWCDLEIGPFELLATKGEMMLYHHKGYWQCMDTMKDMGILQNEWDTGNPRWKL